MIVIKELLMNSFVREYDTRWGNVEHRHVYIGHLDWNKSFMKKLFPKFGRHFSSKSLRIFFSENCFQKYSTIQKTFQSLSKSDNCHFISGVFFLLLCCRPMKLAILAIIFTPNYYIFRKNSEWWNKIRNDTRKTKKKNKRAKFFADISPE